MPRSTETTRRRPAIGRLFILPTLLLLAWGLRLLKLADHNIWWDEGLTVWAARRDVGAIHHWAATDVHPPLYFLLIHLWRGIAGEGEFVLRFPSAIWGALSVAAIYGLGCTLGGKRTGWLAALFLAFSRFAITWSQEMRMYILAALLATLALWAALRYWQTRSRQAWLGYVLAMAAGLWTIYLFVSTLVVVNLAWLVAGRRSLKKGVWWRDQIGWIAAQVVALLLFAPWLVYALPRIPTWSTAQATSPAFFVHLYATLLATGVPLDIERYSLLVLLVFLVLLGGLIALWLQRRQVHAGGALALILGLLLPASIVYVVSLPIRFFYTPRLAPRYLLILSSCFYVLLAWGLVALTRKRRWIGWLGSGVVLSAALVGLSGFYSGRLRSDDYISLSLTLQAYVHPGDAVVLQDDTDWPIFAAHYPGYWHGVPSSRSTDPASVETFLAPIWDQSEGVWLVLTYYARQSDPVGQMQRWLAEHAAQEIIYRFGDTALHFYPRTPARAAAAGELAAGHIPRHPFDLEVGPGLRLVGAEMALPAYRVGDTLHLFLYWEGDATPVELALTDAEARVVRTVPVQPPPGPDRRRQQVDLPLTADLGSGRYVVRLSGQVVARFDLWTDPHRNATAAAIAQPLDLRFVDPAAEAGGEIYLVGYDLHSQEVRAGETAELTLYWRAAVPVTMRYKVFTHLLGESINPAAGSFLWGQHDAEPDNFSRPTTTWPPGEIIADRHTIPLADDAPPGRYRLEIGLYDGLSGDRLEVYDATGALLGDHVVLGELTMP